MAPQSRNPLPLPVGVHFARDGAPGAGAREVVLLLAAAALGACSRESALQFDPAPALGAPRVAGPARYEDRNLDGICNQGDVLIVPFRTQVVLSGAGVPAEEVFALPDWGELCDISNLDSLGTGAVLEPGPGANEVTIALRDGPSLKTRQIYEGLCSGSNPPTGIDLLAPTGRIQNPVDGATAEPSERIDLLPAFVDSGQRLGSETTLSVLLGDLDGDGDLDLVEGNFGRPSSIRPNVANSFGSPAQQIGGGSTRAALLVNVDGDGDLDLLLGNGRGEADELWVNEGGSLTLRQVFGACDTWALTAGDLDGDGDPDLVVADGTLPNVVWENVAGRLVFREELTVEDCDESPCPSPTRAIALADVDRNGELDLVEGNWGEVNRLRLNEGGVFGEPSAIGLEPGATSSLVLGDLDLDGDPDLVTGDGLGADQVWTNVGGAFVDSSQRLGRGATSALALADLDQDGALDLVAGVPGGGSRYWINDRSGLFLDSGQLLPTALTRSIALGDVDRDGDTDLVTGNEGEPNRVWLQSLAGTWGVAALVFRKTLSAGTSFWEVAAVDVDQDGAVDLVAAGPGASSSIWRNDGSAVFARTQNLTPAVDSRAMAVGDIDSDGDPDLIQGSHGDPSPDRLWINDGTGAFSTTAELTNSHSSLDVRLADLDRDGDLDYVQGDEGARVLKVWMNEDGSFTDTLQPFDGGSTTGTNLALAIGDVNEDGFADIVEAFDFRGRVWRNDGRARFVLAQGMTLAASGNVLGLALGDLDLDGDLDLVSTDQNSSTGGNHTWLNANGLFTDSGLLLPGRYISVALADLDGDGDLDVVSGGLVAANAWFRNNRAGFDAGMPFTSASTLARGVCVADLDGDGDLDLVLALQGGSPSNGQMEAWINR